MTLINDTEHPRIETQKQSMPWVEDDTKYESLKEQRKDYDRLLDMEKVRNLQCDEESISPRIKYFFSWCFPGCPHGNRTAGSCVHCTGAARIVRRWLNQWPRIDPHPLSTRIS